MGRKRAGGSLRPAPRVVARRWRLWRRLGRGRARGGCTRPIAAACTSTPSSRYSAGRWPPSWRLRAPI